MTSIMMYLSYNNNEKVVQLPVVPNTLPEILQDLSNETMTTHTKTLTLLGNKKPRSFSLDLFLPTRDYEFCKGNGAEVIDLLDYVTSAKIPARLVIVDNLTELLNIAVAVKSHKHYYDTVGNIRANVDLVEYEFLNETNTQKTNTTALTFKETSVSYGGSSSQIKSANIEGHNLVKARDVLSLLGKDVGWNAEKKRVTADGQLLDIHTEIYDGCAYCYIRDIATVMGVEVKYNANDKSIELGGGN
ncbi:MAG: hypothetical protein Q4D26_11520 [Clostridia bacterium]|nr:hypothetical protein [Clostridia bacterium]